MSYIFKNMLFEAFLCQIAL